MFYDKVKKKRRVDKKTVINDLKRLRESEYEEISDADKGIRKSTDKGTPKKD